MNGNSGKMRCLPGVSHLAQIYVVVLTDALKEKSKGKRINPTTLATFLIATLTSSFLRFQSCTRKSALRRLRLLSSSSSRAPLLNLPPKSTCPLLTWNDFLRSLILLLVSPSLARWRLCNVENLGVDFDQYRCLITR